MVYLSSLQASLLDILADLWLRAYFTCSEVDWPSVVPASFSRKLFPVPPARGNERGVSFGLRRFRFHRLMESERDVLQNCSPRPARVKDSLLS